MEASDAGQPLASVGLLPGPPLRERQKWRLADAARDERDRAGLRKRFKTVAQRPPDFQAVPCPAVGQLGGSPAHDQVDHVHADGLALRVSAHVIKGEGPAQQRVRTRAWPDHEKLAGADVSGHLGVVERQEVRISRQQTVFPNVNRSLSGTGGGDVVDSQGQGLL